MNISVERQKFTELSETRKSWNFLVEELICCLWKSECQYAETQHHAYIHGMRLSLIRTDGILQTLHMAPIMMNSFPSYKSWRSTATRAEYIRYHYETWLIGVVRFEESIYQLINNLYKLGINPKFVSLGILLTHADLDNEIKEDLKMLSKAINPIRTHRNLIIHRRGIYMDDELFKLQKQSDLLKFSLSLPASELDMSDSDYEALIDDLNFTEKYQSKSYLQSKRKEIIISNIGLYDFMKNFDKKIMKEIKKRTPVHPLGKQEHLKELAKHNNQGRN